MDFIKIAPEEIGENTFKAIGSDWMLVSAGEADSFNTMTASWGGMGVLWRKNVAFVFIRPQRYTFEFTEKYDKMSLSFFGGEKREALSLCGRVSGRDCDKIADAGLTPVWITESCVGYEGASLVLECRKMYADDIRESAMLDPDIMANYSARDFHKMYICEIEAVWKAKADN